MPRPESLRRVLAEPAGLRPDVVADPRAPTTLKTRFIAHNQQLLRVDREHRAVPTGEALERLAEAARAACAEADAVILEDYGKGVLGPEVIAAALDGRVDRARRWSWIPTAADYRRYAGAPS